MKSIYFTFIFLFSLAASSYSQWQPLSSNTNTSFYAVKFFNSNTGIIAGQDTVGKIFRTSNGGVTWNIAHRTNFSERFTCVFFINDQTGWAGTYGRSVYKSTDSGLSWYLTATSIGAGTINSISFIDPLNGWLITNDGGAGRTTDGGLSWYMNAPNLSGSAIHFINSLTGVISTFQGTIRKSISAGNGYTEIYQLPANTYVYDFYFLNSQTGYASGHRGLIMKTTNFGSNWFLVKVDPEGPPWEKFYKIYFVDENLGYAAGDWIYSDMSGTYQHGILRKTTNGGLNWTDISLAPAPYSLQDVIITEGQIGYTVGLENKIYKSTNAGYVGINTVSNQIPSQFSLHQNFPNPFNPSTKIRFEIPSNKNEIVQLIVYDVIGRKVKTLVNENLKPGIYETDFNAADFSSGLYFYKLTAGSFSETKKMILIK